MISSCGIKAKPDEAHVVLNIKSMRNINGD